MCEQFNIFKLISNLIESILITIDIKDQTVCIFISNQAIILGYSRYSHKSKRSQMEPLQFAFPLTLFAQLEPNEVSRSCNPRVYLHNLIGDPLFFLVPRWWVKIDIPRKFVRKHAQISANLIQLAGLVALPRRDHGDKACELPYKLRARMNKTLMRVTKSRDATLKLFKGCCFLLRSM